MTDINEVEELARLTVQLASNPKWEQDIAEVLAYLEASEADTPWAIDSTGHLNA